MAAGEADASASPGETLLQPVGPRLAQERNFPAASWHGAWKAPWPAGAARGLREMAPWAAAAHPPSAPARPRTWPGLDRMGHMARTCASRPPPRPAATPARGSEGPLYSAQRSWGSAAQRLPADPPAVGRRGAALDVGGARAQGVVQGIPAVAPIRVLVLAAAVAAGVAGAVCVRAGRVEDHHVGLGPDVLAEPHGLVAALGPPLLGQDGPHGGRAVRIPGRSRGLEGRAWAHRAGGRGRRGVRGRGLGGAGWGAGSRCPVGLLVG